MALVTSQEQKHYKQSKHINMTAVQWLIKELNLEMSEAVETALGIEQNDIEDSFQSGEWNENAYQHTGRRIFKDNEEYYTKIFKNK
jgi:hypothetical protein